jgi:hypothetical protein
LERLDLLVDVFYKNIPPEADSEELNDDIPEFDSDCESENEMDDDFFSEGFEVLTIEDEGKNITLTGE